MIQNLFAIVFYQLYLCQLLCLLKDFSNILPKYPSKATGIFSNCLHIKKLS